MLQLIRHNFSLRSSFNSNEHEPLGDKAFSKWIASLQKPGQDPEVMSLLETFNYKDDEGSVYVQNRDMLKFGDLIALSGDYFSDLERKFNGSLDRNAPGIQNDMEGKALGRSDSWSRRFTGGFFPNPQSLYQSLDSTIHLPTSSAGSTWGLVKYFREQTRKQAKSNSDIALTYFNPTYLLMAAANFNHFGDFAKEEFQQAHKLARKRAFNAGKLKLSNADPACKIDWTGTCGFFSCSGARKSSRCSWGKCRCGHRFGKRLCGVGEQCRLNPAAWTGMLRSAIEISAFGLHYYTDGFAPGHLRVPYSAGVLTGSTSLRSWCPLPGVAGLYTKCMHDKDLVARQHGPYKALHLPGTSLHCAC